MFQRSFIKYPAIPLDDFKTDMDFLKEYVREYPVEETLADLEEMNFDAKSIFDDDTV